MTRWVGSALAFLPAWIPTRGSPASLHEDMPESMNGMRAALAAHLSLGGVIFWADELEVPFWLKAARYNGLADKPVA